MNIQKRKIKNENGDIEDIKEIIDEEEPSEIDEKTGKKKPKVKKYINNNGEIIKLTEQPEKKPKQKKMITKDGKEVKVIDDENEPSEEEIDEKTGKRKPKKKKIINDKGDIEEVENIYIYELICYFDI